MVSSAPGDKPCDIPSHLRLQLSYCHYLIGNYFSSTAAAGVQQGISAWQNDDRREAGAGTQAERNSCVWLSKEDWLRMKFLSRMQPHSSDVNTMNIFANMQSGIFESLFFFLFSLLLPFTLKWFQRYRKVAKIALMINYNATHVDSKYQ